MQSLSKNTLVPLPELKIWVKTIAFRCFLMTIEKNEFTYEIWI